MLRSILNYIAKQYCLYKIYTLPRGLMIVRDVSVKSEVSSEVDVHVLNDTVYYDIIKTGEFGLRDGYCSGKWTSSNLERVMILLMDPLNKNHFIKDLLHSIKTDTIDEYYLDSTYRANSTGFWVSPEDTLESSIKNKLDYIQSKLDIQSEDRVLDIGCGYGMMTNYLYNLTKAKFTGITIYTEELKYAKANADKEITFLKQSYGEMVGQYDKILSIELYNKYDIESGYFEAISNNLKIGGIALIQVSVSMGDISCIVDTISKIDNLRLIGMEYFDGSNYEKTYREWNNRLKENCKSVDHKILRKYEYYFNTCVGAYHNNSSVSCVFVLKKK